MMMIFQIFTLILLPHLLFGQDGYNKVYNEGLSKMEMIEQMDNYLSKDLPGQLNSLKNDFERQLSEAKMETAQLRELLQNLSNKIEKIEEAQNSSTNNNSASIEESLLAYLKDLKKVIVPAIQKKLLDNENQMLNFIQQMTAKLQSEKLIEKEIGSESTGEGANE